MMMMMVREKLQAAEQKHKCFKQQQSLFISALTHSREQAHARTGPVSTVTQVQWYMSHNCNNATDRHIFSLFLKIIGDLRDILRLLEPSVPNTSANESLETCKVLLDPSFDISKLQARYPHDEVNRLSCDEARNYYSGVVSVIPLAIDLLKVASTAASSSTNQHSASASAATESPPESRPQQPATNGGKSSAKQMNNSNSHSQRALTYSKGGWHAGRPIWRPPGCTRK